MHWLNRILVALALVAVVALGPRQYQLVTASEDLIRIRSERAELTETNRILQDEIRLLRAEVEALHEDHDEIARIAREDLNLVAPGEVVFELEHVKDGP